MKAKGLVLLFPLVGCSTGQPEGITGSPSLGIYNGYYTSAPLTLGSGASLMDRALREGADFCGKQQKKISNVQVMKVQDGIPLDRFAVAHIVFECG